MEHVQALDLNRALLRFISQGLKLVVREPHLLPWLGRTIIVQRRAARRRIQSESRGVHVPPYLIASVTHQCNLHCHGCYARERTDRGPELSTARWKQLFTEAQDLGVSVVIVAGGEPLTRPDLVPALADCPDILFLMFTNGLLLDDAVATQLRRHRNLLPILSLEGHSPATDHRRGAGTDHGLRRAMQRLRQLRLPFGVSITTTRENFDEVTAGPFVSELVDAGARLLFFIEYVPVAPSTEALCLDPVQRQALPGLMARLGREHRVLCVAFPGDEKEFGGCLSAGRGFVHISPEGSIEPCPFAPYSDTSAANLGLSEALSSPFLSEIRRRHEQLAVHDGGCALWEHRDLVRALIHPPADRR